MATAPAEPILASTIYPNASPDQHRQEEDEGEDEVAGNATHRRRTNNSHRRVTVKVKTECRGVDEALGEGLGYGEDGGVCCISGGEEEGCGVDEIHHGLLISHLLQSSSSEAKAEACANTATVIDTLGTFDVLKLHRGIVSRLENSHHSPSNHHPESAEQQSRESNVDKAGQILDRVKIMRVFDFEGLVEGIEEMKVELEKLSLRLRSWVQEDEAREDERGGEVGEKKMLQRIKSTIADSQGDDDDEEVDMLDDLPGQALPPLTTTVGDEDNHDKSRTAGERNKQQSHDALNQEQRRIRHNMLIITNLTTVMAPLIKNNYVQGQALLTSFLQSLAHTARQHNICVLVLNSTLTYRDDVEAPSAFSSIVSKPALGKSLGYLVDVHLFVNRIPRAQKDVRAAYAEGRAGEVDRRRVEWVNVVEVLQDRQGDRTGRVGLFSVDGRGVLSNAV